MDIESYLDINNESGQPQETVADIEARLNKAFEEKMNAFKQETAPAVDFYQKIQQGFQPQHDSVSTDPLQVAQMAIQRVQELEARTEVQRLDQEASQLGFSNYAQALSLYEAMKHDKDPNVRNKAAEADNAWRNGNRAEAARIINSHFGLNKEVDSPKPVNLSQGYSPGASTSQTQAFPKMDTYELAGYQMSTKPEHKTYLQNYLNYWNQKDPAHLRELMSGF